jgi:hypothetical protein
MSLRSRLAAVERRLPRPPGKLIVIRTGPRPIIRAIPGVHTTPSGYTLRVPCPWDPPAMLAALTPEQRALIGPNDRVCAARYEGGRWERVALRVPRP